MIKKKKKLFHVIRNINWGILEKYRVEHKNIFYINFTKTILYILLTGMSMYRTYVLKISYVYLSLNIYFNQIQIS